MSLLIDGYNLVYVAGIVGRGVGPGTLQRSRLALLNFLAESLDPAELTHTTVVFDSHDAPWGLPRQVEYHGITVRFATHYEEADDLIEELIRADSAPRRLVVVSSDHRLQRAARRRRANAVDSDVWYAELVRARRERQEASPQAPAQPAVPLLEEDVNYWLRQFGGESAFTELLAKEGGRQQDSSEGPADAPSAPGEHESDKPTPGQLDEIENPFPPGYGEDLLENEEL
jgi:uncharacterized protein